MTHAKTRARSQALFTTASQVLVGGVNSPVRAFKGCLLYTSIIHIGQAIMSQKGSANTLKYFINTTFNYPTMAEAYRVAALNGLNRVF